MKKKISSDHGSQSVYYEKYYESINVRGGGIGSRAFKQLHEAMEKPYNKEYFGRVLEIGAGTGEHLDFVKHEYDEYLLTDIRKPILAGPWTNNPKFYVLKQMQRLFHLKTKVLIELYVHVCCIMWKGRKKC